MRSSGISAARRPLRASMGAHICTRPAEALVRVPGAPARAAVLTLLARGLLVALLAALASPATALADTRATPAAETAAAKAKAAERAPAEPAPFDAVSAKSASDAPLSGESVSAKSASGEPASDDAASAKPASAEPASAVLAGPTTVGRATAAPRRVVSMNLCTDQLAMLLGAEGQLVSVSYLARDPRASAMAAEAAALPFNHGLAEEIFLLRPDLVLAGSFTTRATTALLRRLGIPVAVFEPAYSLEEVRAGIVEMGAALHREAEAEAVLRRFDADLATLEAAPAHRPRAALYYANGYTSGDRTLAGQILAAAGFANIAAEVGLDAGGILPLEQLVMSDPEMVISGRPYPGASRAEELLTHPALLGMAEGKAGAALSDRDWVCGTPYVLRAVAGLAAARRALELRP